jgi:flavodoxin
MTVAAQALGMFAEDARANTEDSPGERAHTRVHSQTFWRALMTDSMETTSAGRILVAYYSITGNTARVARDVATRTGGVLESIRDPHHGVGFFNYLKAMVDAVRGATTRIDPITRNPDKYDLIVIGTPVWAWNATPAVRAYLQQTQGRLKNVAFFVTSGDTSVAKLLPSLEALAKRKAVLSAGFNASELKDQALYEPRLAAFVRGIERSRGATPAVPGGQQSRAA